MKIKYHLLILLIFPLLSFGQRNIHGTVFSEGKPVEFAKVFIPELNKGTYTSDCGSFTLENIPNGKYLLKITSIGYASHEDSISIDGIQGEFNFNLEKLELHLDEVVITGTMKETRIDNSPVKIEILTPTFLRNNACNNIMQALGMVNGIQEQVSCGVCGTNCIHINGMEGAYTLMLIDGMPIMSALASTYGFNGIPNSMIERVEIIRGPSSTLYGTEAVGGVINIITKKPEGMPLISTNVFGTTHGEYNLDFAYSPRLSKNVSTTFSTNLFSNQQRLDYNNDNFTDIPLNDRMTLLNKWDFKLKNDQVARMSMRYYTENRFGGEMQWNPQFKGNDSIYGEYIDTKRWEMIGMLPLPIKDLRIDYSWNSHYQDSWYGTTNYVAEQTIYFANLIWSKKLGRHDWVSGLTTRYQTYTDNSSSFTDEKEYIPGIFFQDEYNLTENTSLLAGIRLDHHRSHGAIIAPRLNIKHKFNRQTTTRLNLGTGFREVHLFTEDHAFYSGSRSVQVTTNLRPEESYNATLNFNRIYSFLNGSGSLDADVYYTYFTNKIVPDYDVDPNLIVYDNLKGYSIIKGITVNMHHSFEFPLSFNLGMTFMDVYQIIPDENGNEIRDKQEFTPAVSGTIGFNYKIKKAGLTINWTGKITGPQKLPEYNAPYERATVSPWYSLHNVQLTKKFKYGIEAYLGVKNVFNYTQDSPLINPENPFSSSFDTAYAYGPLQTRRFMLGLRWDVERKMK